jgi:FtsZ-interacting cell division protein YlmF
VEGKFQGGSVPPFYVSLNIHDKILHNAMLDSGASHNLMPKVVMERLGLEITRPYKYLYSFDSNRVKCLGLIKDICVNIEKIPSKSLVMDIIVADIPPKYGMLLSRSWGAKLQGTLQMDMTYATVPIFSQPRRLYRENHMKYMVRSQEKPDNSPLYYFHTDLDSFILYNVENVNEQVVENEKTIVEEEEKEGEQPK